MADTITIGGYTWEPRKLGPAKGQRIAVLYQRPEDRLALAGAALALSYQHRGGPPPAWGDPVAYPNLVALGDAVVDHLCERGAAVVDIMRVGLPVVLGALEAFNAVSLPHTPEIEEARDFS